MRAAVLAIAALLPCMNVAAHADTFETFQVSIPFTYGVAFGGLIVLDTTTNLFTSFNGAANGLATGNGGFFSFRQGFNGENYFVESPGSGPYSLSLILPVTSLVGYDGSAVCTASLGAGCFSASTLGYATATGGALTPVIPATVTPEPASIALLGTGVLGLAGVLRKRVVQP